MNASPPAQGLSANSMAVERTRLAYERTMMAWTRTGTSLISFGFSIYKFADILEGKSGGRGMLGPQAYGSGMILTGLLALVVATLQHRAGVRELRATGAKVPLSLAAVVAVAVTILGIGALGLVIFRR
jgi:putative membrane protein